MFRDENPESIRKNVMENNCFGNFKYKKAISPYPVWIYPQIYCDDLSFRFWK